MLEPLSEPELTDRILTEPDVLLTVKVTPLLVSVNSPPATDAVLNVKVGNACE